MLSDEHLELANAIIGELTPKWEISKDMITLRNLIDLIKEKDLPVVRLKVGQIELDFSKAPVSVVK